MPIYDYQCTSDECKCEFEEFRHIEDREDMACPKCGTKAKLLISRTKDDWFRPHWNEHLTHEPVFVESKGHYKQLCKKYGVQARCLM